MHINNKHYRTIWYDEKSESVKIIDQTRLPFELKIVTLRNLYDVIQAINSMKVRGAPLIGATAAFGVYLAYRDLKNKNKIYEDVQLIKNTRPTAVNLFWAIDKMMSIVECNLGNNKLEKKLLEEAKNICENDIKQCKEIGINGLRVIEEIFYKKNNKVNILTHCNAGWLATIDWGTATSPIYQAKKKNIDIHVWVDETRPRNQGAALTSYELNNEEVDNTIIADNTAGLLMQRGQIDICIVGADRVTNTGHVANKIGTFLKAIAAKEFNIPFYVAIPTNTIDWETKNFQQVIIEERSGHELSRISGLDSNNKIRTVDIYPTASKVYNPAFDLTPNSLVESFITNKGIIKATEKGLAKLKDE